jgi:hypothetical protein
MTRLEIIQLVTPRFSYDGYVATCKANNFDYRLRGEWAQLMGMVSAAEVLFPGEQIDTAYGKYLEVIKAEQVVLTTYAPQPQPTSVPGQLPVVPPKPCGTCGGGKVL